MSLVIRLIHCFQKHQPQGLVRPLKDVQISRDIDASLRGWATACEKWTVSLSGALPVASLPAPPSFLGLSYKQGGQNRNENKSSTIANALSPRSLKLRSIRRQSASIVGPKFQKLQKRELNQRSSSKKHARDEYVYA